MQPRIKIFALPNNIKPIFADDYINAKVAEFLTDLGQVYNPKTLRLSFAPYVGFVLYYDSNKVKAITDDMFFKDETNDQTQEILQPVRLDAPKPEEVEKVEQVSKGTEKRPSKTNQVRNTKK